MQRANYEHFLKFVPAVPKKNDLVCENLFLPPLLYFPCFVSFSEMDN